MSLLAFELGPFAARCVVLLDDDSREAAIVDPGFDVGVALDAAAARGAVIGQIVLTHAHLDHAAGVATVRERFPGARVLLHPDDLPLYRNLPAQAQMFGMPAPAVVEVDGELADGAHVRVGGASWSVRHCPGHSPGHIVLIGQDGGGGVAVVGDVLFAGSIGRTDLWGGSFEQLASSIRSVLYRLPDETRVVPGHGPETTIGEERRNNPFVPEGDDARSVL